MTRSALKTGRLLWYSILAFGLVIGLYGTAYMLQHGHEAAFNVTREIPWGILISSYEYFMAASAGLLLIANLGYVFGREEFKVLGRRALVLALFTMVAAFAIMAVEIAHPVRMVIYAILSPNLASPLMWVGLSYGAYGLFLVLQLAAVLLGRERALAALGVFGILASIAVLTNMGAILGVAKARPLWYGSFMPLYFAVSGVVSAAALLSVVAFFSDRISGVTEKANQGLKALGRFQGIALAILAVMVVWKLIPGLYGAPPGKYEATLALIEGPLAVNFWVFEIILGLVLPMGLLLGRDRCTPVAVMASGVMASMGVFAMRYDLIIAGQIVPVRKGVDGLVDGLLQYSPSSIEIALVVGASALCLLLYSLAERVLGLKNESF